jgi:hypothetical protein
VVSPAVLWFVVVLRSISADLPAMTIDGGAELSDSAQKKFEINRSDNGRDVILNRRTGRFETANLVIGGS